MTTTNPFAKPINPFAKPKPASTKPNPFGPATPKPATQFISTSSIKPVDYGLSASRFPDWRDGQRELHQRVYEFAKRKDGPKILMISAPTGIGKSLVAASAVLRLLKEDPAFNSVITSPTVNLQLQYINETFEHKNAKAAWGRNKHDCLIMDVRVDQAPCQSGYQCDQQGECPYFVERDDALRSSVTVLNSTFWLTLANYAHGINGAADRALAIHDEAHALEPTIRGLVTATLNRSFWGGLSIKFPAGDSTTNWQEWILEHEWAIKRKAAESRAEVRKGANPEQFRAVFRAEEAFFKIRDYILPSSPMITRNQYGVQFEPIWGSDFAEDMLWTKAKKHVLMSATLNHSYFAGTMGLNREDYEVIELDSPFHPMRRRVIYDPVIKVNARTKPTEFAKLVAAMDNHLDDPIISGKRGIIHTVSFARAKLVMEYSRHADRMITHRPGDMQSKQLAIDELVGSEDGILVSPSVGVGEDFGRGDNVRFQFFVKYPIPNMGDPVVRARVEDWKDSLWYEADMAFVQAIGRGTRSADDWCINYVLDGGAGWRLSHLPPYIQDAIVHPAQG